MDKNKGENPPVPSNREAEEAVIGALLLEPEVISRVVSLLKPPDFFFDELAAIFKAVCLLYSDQTPADLVNLHSALRKMNLLASGSPPEPGKVELGLLSRLLSQTATPFHVEHHARQVRKESLRRKLLRMGSGLAAAAYDYTREPEEILEKWEIETRRLSGWTISSRQNYFMSHEGMMELDFWEERAEQPLPANPAQPGGVPLEKAGLVFGLPQLDGKGPEPGEGDWMAEPPRMVLQPCTLTAILADTGAGKTIMAEQIAEANASRGASVLFFHNELSHDQMRLRRYARLTGMSLHRLAPKGGLSIEELEQVMEATNSFFTWPGRVDFVHCPGWDGRRVAEELRVRHSARKVATGKGYDMFLVDYVQRLARPAGLYNAANKVEELEQNVLQLGEAANEMEMVGIITSQVRREMGEGADKSVRPNLHNALNGGSIERFSNQVLGLWRDGEYGELHGLKSTFGDRGWTVKVTFMPGRFRFY